jgi:hypothetical protein
MTPVTLPPSGHAAWDDFASWWLSRYKPSTQRTYATCLPRWNGWCAGRRIDPLAARPADVELWLHTVVDSGLSRASIAAHHDAVASLYRLAYEEELVAANPKRAPLRRRDRQGRRDHPDHRPTRAAPNRRHRRSQPGHPAAGCPAAATPRPP